MQWIKVLGAAIAIVSASLVFVMTMAYIQMNFDERNPNGKAEENTAK